MPEDIQLSLYHAEPLICMLDLAASSPPLLALTIHYVERIAFANRRNQAILNEAHFCRHLSRLLDSGTLPVPLAASAQKSYKRVLEMGLKFEEAEELFKELMTPPPSESDDFSLSSGALERVKSGMRTAGIWPPFVSIGDGKTSSRSGIQLSNSRLRGRSFPSALGFTFMVSQPRSRGGARLRILTRLVPYLDVGVCGEASGRR